MQARGSNGLAPSPIGYQDIAAWAALMGTNPTPFEVGLLRRLDIVALSAASGAITPAAEPVEPPPVPEGAIDGRNAEAMKAAFRMLGAKPAEG